jgi:pseudouridine-5'-phosphate glycosidase
MSIAERLLPNPEVADALATGRPVVALESTLISHGLPYPNNIAVARASEAAVRESGAVPATVAIRDGRILVGLAETELEALATAPAGSVLKAARPSMAVALARDGWAATTVSATMIAADAAGIRVFATGGIGGVHRGALGGGGRGGAAGDRGAPGGAGAGEAGGGERAAVPATLDISSDLEELARTPVVVVCAGPKSILDLPLTLEYLETRGVPVVAVGQTDMPGFFSRGTGVPAPASVPDEAAAARLAGTHLGLRLGSGMLVCVPVPAPAALPYELARSAVDQATAEADAAGVHGPALTPWLLARIAELTGGASLHANTALIENDARVAGRLAVALSAAVAAASVATPGG